MENPLEWNNVEKVINAALEQHRKDLGEDIIGASDVRYIYNALRDHGFLKDEYN